MGEASALRCFALQDGEQGSFGPNLRVDQGVRLHVLRLRVSGDQLVQTSHALLPVPPRRLRSVMFGQTIHQMLA